MFKSMTLFIVGAGASQEAGLPTGTQLKDAIAEKLGFENISGSWGSGDPDIHEAIRQYASQANLNANDIFRGAEKIRENMPLAPSIDHFIHTHSTNTGIVVCGKLAIAQAILEAERNSSLSLPEEPGRSNQLDFNRIQGTWYQPLFHLLNANLRNDEVDTIFSNVSVITFNYDRCIEHFLYYALQNYFAVHDIQSDIQRLMQRLPILHPYGVVGSLPWQDPRTNVSFGGVGRNSNLLDIANQIRTFTERVGGSDPTLATIRLQVQEAETIVFLGFAFHELNLELLKPEAAGNVRRVFGTGLEISDTDVTTIIVPEISETFKKDVRRATRINNKLSCCQLFGEYWHTLSRG
jgi:hypothetical protein